jgi:predicted nucleic acid-binding protein
MNVVDSSGWMEYLQDTPRADLFAAAIEDRNHLLVPTIALFEVHRVLSRSLDARLVNRCLDVMRLGRVLDLTDARAVAAAQIAARHKLAMADAAMYTIAREFDATFWTQDADYQGLDGVRYQPKPGT